MISTLNQRQQRFIHHYFKGLSITRAAMESGYSQHAPSAAVQGHRLLKNVKVVNAIEYLNEQSGIIPSSVISKLASVFHHKNTKASDLIKLSKLFFKIEGLDLNTSGTRRSARSKEYEPRSYTFEPNGYPYNKEGIEEDISTKEIEAFNLPESDSLQAISQAYSFPEAIPLKVEQAIPKSFPKAIPKPVEVRKPTPAYSLFGFKGDDESDSTSQTRGKVFYPA